MEDNLEDVFVRLKTKIDLLSKVMDIFKNTEDKQIQMQIQLSKQELENEMNLLAMRGYNMINLSAKLEGDVYKTQIITAQETLKSLAKKRDIQVVDLVNQDVESFRRAEQTRINRLTDIDAYRRAYMNRVQPQLYFLDDQNIQQQIPQRNDQQMSGVQQNNIPPSASSQMSELIMNRMNADQLLRREQRNRQRDIQMNESIPSYDEFVRSINSNPINVSPRLIQRNIPMRSPSEEVKRDRQIRTQPPRSQVAERNQIMEQNLPSPRFQEESKAQLRIQPQPTQIQQPQFNSPEYQSAHEDQTEEFQYSPNREINQHFHNAVNEILSTGDDLNEVSIEQFKNIVSNAIELNQQEINDKVKSVILNYLRGMKKIYNQELNRQAMEDLRSFEDMLKNSISSEAALKDFQRFFDEFVNRLRSNNNRFEITEQQSVMNHVNIYIQKEASEIKQLDPKLGNLIEQIRIVYIPEENKFVYESPNRVENKYRDQIKQLLEASLQTLDEESKEQLNEVFLQILDEGIQWIPNEVVMKEVKPQKRGRNIEPIQEDLSDYADTGRTRSQSPWRQNLNQQQQKDIDREQKKLKNEIIRGTLNQQMIDNILGVYDNYIKIQNGQLDPSQNIFLSDIMTKNVINKLLEKHGKQKIDIKQINKLTLQQKKNMFQQYLNQLIQT